MNDALPLVLTAPELVYLADHIENKDIDEGDPDNPRSDRPLARGLLLKLGSLYLQLVTPTGLGAGEATVYVDEREAWLLRGKVKTDSVAVNREVIGPALLLKLYDLLLRFYETTLTVIGAREEEWEVQDWRARLEEWNNANRSPDKDTD